VEKFCYQGCHSWLRFALSFGADSNALEIAPMVDIPIVLDSASDKPIYLQLYEALRQAIADGQLKSGEPFPSTRDLSRKLGVSRHTVLKATELLVGHGYLESNNQTLKIIRSEDHQSQFVESPKVVTELPPNALSHFGHRVVDGRGPKLAAELNFGASPFEELPVDQWRKILLKHLRDGFNPIEFELVGDRLGYMPLREAIASYLNRFRSLRCHPDNVVIFSGPSSALDFVARLMIDPGDKVILENPGFQIARRIFIANGAEVVPIPVDSEGLIIDKLQDVDPGAKLIYLTPAHHDPTGAVLTMERRKALIEWSKRTGSFIVEDGFDSEYWYKMRPLPAIQGLDDNDCVIYLSSFWRALFPVSRVGFAIFPDRWMPIVQELKSMLEREVPVLEQKVITDFLLEGYMERHLRRSHRLYAHRRQEMIISLTKQFGSKVSMGKESGGMNLLIELNVDATEEEILAAARNAKLPLLSTREYYILDPVPKQFLLPFAHLDDEQILNAAKDFAAHLQPQ
jgi:GntR family transcriptional regulator/MocR family aminotransferase